MLERKTTTKVDTKDTGHYTSEELKCPFGNKKDQSIGSIRSGDSTEGRNNTADSEPVEDRPVNSQDNDNRRIY